MNATENPLLLMNTAPIRSVIAHMLIALRSYMRSDASLNKKCKRVRQLLAFYRVLITMESYNREKILRAKMLADPAWRAQVYADLGGWFAMQHWRLRMRRARQRVRKVKLAPQPTITSERHKPRPARLKHPVKTDRRGQFRLAPIPLGARETPHQRSERAFINRSGNRASKPIPLWPQDFETTRVEVVATPNANDTVDVNEPSAIEAPPPNTSDPPTE